MSTPTFIFGSHQIGSVSDEDLQTFVDVLKRHKISHIDTALVYDGSEKRLGEIAAAETFVVDTKSPAFADKALSRESLVAGIGKSLSLLRADKVDVYYLHAPDEDTPIEETVDTIQELYRQGKFERFGLSNFLPEDVRKVYAYAKSTGGIVPSVYQGNYNAFARSIENDLFPTLRELGFSFYAYSPLAGGFFAKDPEHLASNEAGGRFDLTTLGGQMYNTLYNKPATVAGLRQWKKLAGEAGVSSVALAYRWIVFHSQLSAQKGDAVVLGASKPAQLEQTIETLRAGPLESKTVEGIEKLWKSIEADAPLDNFHSFAKGYKK